jgi:hypothetical protein
MQLVSFTKTAALAILIAQLCTAGMAVNGTGHVRIASDPRLNPVHALTLEA